MDRRPSHLVSGTDIVEAEPAHVNYDTASTASDDEREATELSSINGRSSIRSIPQPPKYTWLRVIDKFWQDHIRLSVPRVDCRDHLANERTFLSYMRTSLGLSVLGVVIAQLFRLQHSPTPSPVFGYYVIGTPLAVIMQCAALLVLLVGAVRFWRQQMAMARGKIHVSGWEVWTVIVVLGLILLMLFVLQVAIEIYKAIRD